MGRRGASVIPADNDNGEDRRKRDQSDAKNSRAAHYRGKADECLRLAELAPDAAAREHWIEIAN
jgi:hypothetical protein